MANNDMPEYNKDNCFDACNNINVSQICDESALINKNTSLKKKGYGRGRGKCKPEPNLLSRSGVGRGRRKEKAMTSSVSSDQDNKHTPKFIPPSDVTVPATKAPRSVNHNCLSQEPNWSCDTGAQRASPGSMNHFIEQQRAKQSPKQTNASQHVVYSDDDDDDDGYYFGGSSSKPRMSAWMLAKRERDRKEKELKQERQAALFDECMVLNPCMPVHWIKEVMLLDDKLDTAFPRHDEILNSKVPIGSSQVG